jgi:polysaccharide export outer membrane protein
LAFCAVLALWFATGSTAQQPGALPTPDETVSAQSGSTMRLIPEERYRIGPGDVLEIRVFERPSLSRDALRVDGNGVIYMPLIQNGVMAACQTEYGLAEGIADRYRVYLKNPQVEVFVKEFSSEPVEVIGEVTKPGSFQLQRRVRLRELLTLAGGPSAGAGATIRVIHDESSLLCDPNSNNNGMMKINYSANGDSGSASDAAPSGSGDPTVSSYNLRAILRGESGSNPYILPGDFIHIPKADQVFVVGNVSKPTPIALTGPLAVSRAIATAGGVLPDTKRSHIKIVRSGSEGNRELFVDLEQIDKNQQPDLLLEPNDIVEVPTSIGKVALRAFFTGIVPAYAIYGPLTLIH